MAKNALRTLVVGIAVGGLLALPCTGSAAWSRTYGFGSVGTLVSLSEITFLDDTVMPLSSLTAVTVLVDNEAGAALYAQARCCKRNRAGATVPGWTCDLPVSGPTGLGVQAVTMSGSALTYCKSTSTTVPFLQLNPAGTGSETAGSAMFVAGVDTSGS